MDTNKIIIRQATVADIPQIQRVRNAVLENRLSNPSLVSDQDCNYYLSRKGRGWVSEIESHILGFAIVDLQDNSVWALFVDPDFANTGIGKKLHQTMLDWYFSQTTATIWLSTAPHTRAAGFYRMAGWVEVGTHNKGEIKFEMTYSRWAGERPRL